MQVRIKGYAAIVDVSREQQKWVKRNADVLVQLLQSGESKSLTPHSFNMYWPGINMLLNPTRSFCYFAHIILPRLLRHISVEEDSDLYIV